MATLIAGCGWDPSVVTGEQKRDW